MRFAQPFLAMTDPAPTRQSRTSVAHWWIRRGFLLWAVISTLWIANSYRTQGVAREVLQSSPTVSVVNEAATLQFLPTQPRGATGLVFLCGAGVAAKAYAPLLRPLAEVGYLVVIVRLPYRIAPLESHKQAAVERVFRTTAEYPQVSQWVLAGHSLGGALACRSAQANPQAFAALALIGTTHPKEQDLSALPLSVTKVFASNDGVAARDRTLANKRFLPATTKWVEIDGGNHSQFGHYGHQLFDGSAAISREVQQATTRSILLEALAEAALGQPDAADQERK